MTLNATLLVQIFHFLIAYLILDRLFLRKAVGIIQQEKAEQDALMQEIQKERDAVAQKHAQKEKAWQGFQQQFAKETPRLIQRPRFSEHQKEMPYHEEPTKNEVQESAALLQELLTQKVTHDIK